MACIAAADFLPAVYASIIIGLLIAAAASYVMLVAMTRGMQLSILGAAIGVSADGAYAKLTDQTPLTIANGIVNVANSLMQSTGLIATSAGIQVTATIPIAVWSFVLGMAAIMLASFLFKHE
jgi:hypothetical protein